MQLAQIIAELEGAAQQEAAGIHVLETTRFEPELGLVAGNCLAAARRRAEALASAAQLLRDESETSDLVKRCRKAAANLRAFRDALIGLQQVAR